MMLEYWQYEDSSNSINTLYEGLRFEKDSFLVEIKRVENIKIERKYDKARLDKQEMTHVFAVVVSSNREEPVQVYFRHTSKIVFIETNNGILVADAVYDILTEDMGIGLTQIEPTRDKIREFLSSVRFLDVKIDTWQGERSLAEIKETQGDPILRYGMSSAEIEMDCDGTIILKITLDYIHTSGTMTNSQKECAIELVETHLI